MSPTFEYWEGYTTRITLVLNFPAEKGKKITPKAALNTREVKVRKQKF